MKDFKSIIYKQNIFGELSLALIPQLLQRRIPYHLEQLRIIDCKIQQSVSRRLVDHIVAGSHLYKLALVNCNLSV